MKQSFSLNWSLTYVVGNLLNQFQHLQRSTKNFHHNGRPAETTRPSYQVSKVLIQEIEKKSTSPSIPTKPPMKMTPCFQAGRI